MPQSVLDEAANSTAPPNDKLTPPSVVLPSVPASLRPFLPPHSSCPPFLLRPVDHALGVAFWAVPLLFRHSSAAFAAQRLQPHGELLSMMRCTRTLLLINADNATAWNARKRQLSSTPSSSHSTTSTTTTTTTTSSSSSPLAAELRFLSFLFSKHPKSSEAWAHRRWTAQRVLESEAHEEAEALLALLRSELAVVEMTAERYPKNYHAWLYRQWIVNAVGERLTSVAEHRDGNSKGRQGWVDVLEEEKQRIGAWNESHMSDHSGWHYRSFVVDRLLRHCSSLHCTPSALLDGELSYLSSLQSLYPAHESTWSYRRYLLHSAIIAHTEREEAERQQLRQSEDEWCDGREQGACCSTEDEARLEKRYAALHRLYVTELMVRAAGAESQQMEGLLRAMQEPDRARWLCDVAAVQRVYPRQVWADRVALVT